MGKTGTEARKVIASIDRQIDAAATVKRLRAGKHYTDPGPFMNFMGWLEAQSVGSQPIDPAALAAKIAEIHDLVAKAEA